MSMSKSTFAFVWGSILLILPPILLYFLAITGGVDETMKGLLDSTLEGGKLIAGELTNQQLVGSIFFVLILGGFLASVMFYCLLGGIGYILLLILGELRDQNVRLR